MAGLVKAKEFDWKDSNMALIGTDTDRSAKKASAETEAAWKGAGQKVGVQIWRIVKFKVTTWPSNEYGSFYDGDSYIILNTFKEPDSEALEYDLHFWIGKHSTQDEYGTAAYKTVELDSLLDDKPIQHREVQDGESDMFLSYFPALNIMSGGAETGFKHVEPKSYTPRLMHFHGDKKRIIIREVALKKASIDSSDVFILDLGLKIFQWNGKTCNKDEKFKAVQWLQTIKSERGGKCAVETLDELDIKKTHEFYTSLSDEPLDESEKAPAAIDKLAERLFRVSDASGTLKVAEVQTAVPGDIKTTDLDSNDVFIIDGGNNIFVWIGSAASDAEKSNGFAYGTNYLNEQKRPTAKITIVRDKGRYPSELKTILA